MIKGDAEYNKHFYNMVADAIACGLSHPIEWLISYDRCIGIAYTDYPAVSKFCSLAGYDLYEMCTQEKTDDIRKIQEWVDKYYAKART